MRSTDEILEEIRQVVAASIPFDEERDEWRAAKVVAENKIMELEQARQILTDRRKELVTELYRTIRFPGLDD